MKATMTVLFVSIVLVLALMTARLETLERRIRVVERVCHGQCKYGDADCAKRCAAEGHCPQQD